MIVQVVLLQLGSDCSSFGYCASYHCSHTSFAEVRSAHCHHIMLEPHPYRSSTELIKEEDNHRLTPTHWAIAFDHVDQLKILIKW